MRIILFFILSILLFSCQKENAGSPRTTGQTPTCGTHPIVGQWQNLKDTISFNVSRTDLSVKGTWFTEGALNIEATSKVIDIYSDNELILIINDYTPDTINVFIPMNDTFTQMWR